MNNYEKAVEIYERGGQYAVYEAVSKGELTADGWHLCVPCETPTPYEDGVCLVCGSPIKEHNDDTQ